MLHSEDRMNGPHQDQLLLQMYFMCDMCFRTYELWVPVSNEYNNPV